MLDEPGLEFLRLCDDSQWKLREWTQLNYSPWAKQNGIQEARPKREPEGDNPLNNADLIQIEPKDKDLPEDADPEEHVDLKDTDNDQDDADIQRQKGSSGQASQEVSAGENMRPRVSSLVIPS